MRERPDLLEARPEWILDALDEVRREHGGAEAYLLAHGAPPDDLARLRAGSRAMTVLRSGCDAAGAARRSTARRWRRLEELEPLLETARGGGGPKYVERHRERGKLLVRERIELLLDRDSPFLELQPFIAHGTDYHVGGSLVTGSASSRASSAWSPATTRRSAAAPTTPTRCARRCARRRSPSATGCR